MTDTDVRINAKTAAKGGRLLATIVGVLLLALLVAVAWSVAVWVLSTTVGIVWLALKIAAVIFLILVALVIVGWIRVHVFKR